MKIYFRCIRNNGGFLPDIMLLTLCYYHRGTRLNAIKRICSHLNVLTIFPLDWGMLGQKVYMRSDFSLKYLILSRIELTTTPHYYSKVNLRYSVICMYLYIVMKNTMVWINRVRLPLLLVVS